MRAALAVVALLLAGCSVVGRSLEDEIKETRNAFAKSPGAADAKSNLARPVASVTCSESSALDHVEGIDAAHNCVLTFEDGGQETICVLSRGSRRLHAWLPGTCEAAAAGGWGQSRRRP